MYYITLEGKARKELKKITGGYKERIFQALATLKQKPTPYDLYDLKKIDGLEDTYRIRISSYRIIYRAYWLENTIRILKVERRSETTYK
ncbi:MAG: type II toxin-antitoxin system RelE/ParE family toxin [Candidatus Micrarchaeota archaeon]